MLLVLPPRIPRMGLPALALLCCWVSTHALSCFESRCSRHAFVLICQYCGPYLPQGQGNGMPSLSCISVSRQLLSERYMQPLSPQR